MIRLPVPTRTEVRLTAWVGALCLLMLVGTASWAIVHKVNQSDQLIRVAASSSAQVSRLSDQIDAQAEASAQRQRQLKTQNQQVHAELTTLLRYLRKHGIQVPQTALTPKADRGGVTRPKASTPSPSSPRPSPRSSSTPASPGHTATPTPTGSPSGLTDQMCALLNLSPCLMP